MSLDEIIAASPFAKEFKDDFIEVITNNILPADFMLKWCKRLAKLGQCSECAFNPSRTLRIMEEAQSSKSRPREMKSMPMINGVKRNYKSFLGLHVHVISKKFGVTVNDVRGILEEDHGDFLLIVQDLDNKIVAVTKPHLNRGGLFEVG